MVLTSKINFINLIKVLTSRKDKKLIMSLIGRCPFLKYIKNC